VSSSLRLSLSLSLSSSLPRYPSYAEKMAKTEEPIRLMEKLNGGKAGLGCVIRARRVNREEDRDTLTEPVESTEKRAEREEGRKRRWNTKKTPTVYRIIPGTGDWVVYTVVLQYCVCVCVLCA
jgi:hypothetical protein